MTIALIVFICLFLVMTSIAALLFVKLRVSNKEKAGMVGKVKANISHRVDDNAAKKEGEKIVEKMQEEKDCEKKSDNYQSLVDQYNKL